MVQLVEVLATRPDDLGSLPAPSAMAGKKRLPAALSLPLCLFISLSLTLSVSLCHQHETKQNRNSIKNDVLNLSIKA